MESLLVIIILLGMIGLGFPVFASLCLASLFAFIMMDGWVGLEHLSDIIFARLDTYAFVAIPLFTLMAQLLMKTGVVEDLYRLTFVITRRARMGVGAATILIATLFSAISGSSVATAATLSTTSVPEMLRNGYGRKAAYGLSAAGGTLGILIPPSIALIIYGIIADVSITALFIAAIAPAAILISLFLIYDVIVFARRDKATDRLPERERINTGGLGNDPVTAGSAFRASVLLAVPILIMIGLYAGVFTPSEAGAVGVIAALLVALLIGRMPSLGTLNDSCISAARTSGVVFAIVAGAALFGHVLVLTEAPANLLDLVSSLEINKITFLLILMATLFVLGMFLEGASITLVTTPLLIPVLDQLDIDRLWYGILLVVNLEMSLISPPVGLNLMVLKGTANADYLEVVQGSIPYIAMMMLCVGILITFPAIVTFLPNAMK